MKQEKIDKVFMECYRRMFKESEPSGNIDKIIKSGEGKMPDFFLAYYLPIERIEEIMEEVFKEFKVAKYDQRGITTGILLGASPCGDRKILLKQRKDYDKRLKKFLKDLAIKEKILK